MNKATIIKLHNITNRFGKHTVHKNLNLDVYKGEVLSLIGGSGSGKSVLLRCMLGLRHPTHGTVSVFNTNIQKASESELQKLRKRWGVLFQGGALFSSLTVKENIATLLNEYTNLNNKLVNEIAMLKIRMVGLPENSADKYPSQLSGGMIKRAGLARALALDPELLFLDEPTAGLDPISAEAFDALIVSLKETLGLTVCIVTHDLDTLFAISDRVAVLAEKKIAAIGTIDEVKQVPLPWIQEYFNGKRGREVSGTQEKNKL
ncbi:ABC transporter ATP-binding protein [Desulfovibrio litoralis]|uniref:Phospholipid/cholesterol/gamma-HCH transport system ATP-binding protein n=1 Tax=Desulfovibrio litoralis DSM 11393 TaxID=1121455 RepID=A0A1M7RRM9_9BACT|nr:ABC transporter ATP-binding protein [Desulfovibrio litoralis]SHN48899.1 phospholipid/cholesterol/gamma-HCH transport system ATP-binding protein [Desulfovibrio litoralis DSM 11393]